MDRAALIIVDVQIDFLPGGSLGVENGDAIVSPIVSLLKDEEWKWGLVVATQDYHPSGHISFASRHKRDPFKEIKISSKAGEGEEYTQMLWPDHCIRGTSGIELAESLGLALKEYQGEKVLSRKGYDVDRDAYSGFEGYLTDFHDSSGPEEGKKHDPTTHLANLLRERSISKVVVVGLALDFCVAFTAKDSLLAGFQTAIVKPLTRGVRREGCENTSGQFVRDGGVMLGAEEGVDWKQELRDCISSSQ